MKYKKHRAHLSFYFFLSSSWFSTSQSAAHQKGLNRSRFGRYFHCSLFVMTELAIIVAFGKCTHGQIRKNNFPGYIFL